MLSQSSGCDRWTRSGGVFGCSLTHLWCEASKRMSRKGCLFVDVWLGGRVGDWRYVCGGMGVHRRGQNGSK